MHQESSSHLLDSMHSFELLLLRMEMMREKLSLCKLEGGGHKPKGNRILLDLLLQNQFNNVLFLGALCRI